MTEHQDARAWVRKLFSDAEPPPPRDVVDSPGLTREALERQSANYGKAVTGTIPGEILTDPDGNPIGVTESREVTSLSGGTFISQAEADRLGIADGDLPGIYILTKNERN